jgi:hypothetical protein
MESTEPVEYEIWQDDDPECTSTALWPADSESKVRMLSEGAKLLKTFKAATWEEAATVYNEFCGYGPYVPMKD